VCNASPNHIDLSLFIEETFGVVINDKELKAETLDTLEKFVAVITSRKR
jgi:acyl carrier protein